MDNEEHEMGTLCIGSPIRDHSGKVIAAMSVSWPLFRFDSEQTERMGQAIQEATARISRLMGYTGG
jgi:IclR family KDG regulon transcriptional repressor